MTKSNYADPRILQYYTSTQAGSSCSPVFDDAFAVVAIHHSAVQVPGQADPKPPTLPQWRNQDTSMIAVRDALKDRAPALLAEMAILD